MTLTATFAADTGLTTEMTAEAVIDALRHGKEPRRAAAALGLDLSLPHAGVGLSFIGTQQRRWATAVSWLDQPCSREGPVAWTVVQGDVERELARLRGRLELVVGADQVRAASGQVVSDVRDTATSFQSAEALLRVLLHRQGEVELPFQRAGLAQVLLAVPADRLHAFVDQHLGPIAGRRDLLSTLECWLATGGSRQAVSERLHLHRNSVGYRVGLIKQLLGVDPLEPQAAAVLRTALAARELLVATAEPPA
jgi:sugar diacid utilization regulator